MSSAPSDALLLQQLIPSSNPLPQGYYRSKLFSAPTATNPFVAAASPLFSVVERLSATRTIPAIDELKISIDHEWKSYRSRLTSLKTTDEFIIVAEYLLSATMDEIIGKTYLRLEGAPAHFVAYTPLSSNDIGPEKRFFELIDFMKKRPHQYLDLLELAYYCLICGFEGELHLRADGRHTLDNLIHELYELILQHRAHKPIRLFKAPLPQAPTQQEKYHPWFWKTLFIGVGMLFTLYLFSQGLLDYQAKNIYFNQKIHLDE